ncbi:ankyrin repeat domain-containing protein [Serratia marcescens]|uniref:ankyrin repeat domain-containing protein n=1 Tax=Serratia marcescens TaxID=615 RepID=UPI001F14D70F|nr:ankyrin repeat domain-containing protein [Serratia marcescens]
MSSNHDDEMLFHIGCINGSFENVKELLKNGVNPLSQDEDGISGLDYAASHGHLEIFKLVQKAAFEKAPIQQRQRDTFKAMNRAIANGHENIVDYVLEAEKEPEQWLVDDGLNTCARFGELEMAKKFVAKGADIHNQDNAPLRRAADHGHTETVKFLIEQGADVKAGDSEALIQSARNGHTAIVDLLLKHGADIHAKEDDALGWASIAGHANTVESLLNHGADINAQGREAVLWAARKGHNDVLDVFLKRGIDIFDQNECPINEAIYNNHLSVAQNIIITHNITLPEKSITELQESKETAIQLGKNTSIFDETFRLIEKQNLHNKLRNNLAHKNTQSITKAGKTKEKKMKI